MELQWMVEDYGYIPTDEYNGRKVANGRQSLIITKAARVPLDWNGNPRIVARGIATAKRGGQYGIFIYENGFVAVLGKIN